MTAPVYATLEDYKTWSSDDTTTVADALFARASEVLDEALIGAVYAVDRTTLQPTVQTDIDALRDATCAQVQWMLANGDTTGTGSAEEWAAVSIGSVSLSGRKTVTQAPVVTASGAELAPAAYRRLRIEGLIPAAVIVYG